VTARAISFKKCSSAMEGKPRFPLWRAERSEPKASAGAMAPGSGVKGREGFYPDSKSFVGASSRPILF